MSMTFSGGLCSAMRATGSSIINVSRTRSAALNVAGHVIAYRLIADFRTSPMVESGSRAPVFSAIHFFSLLMMSSSNFLSAARRHVVFQVLFVGAVVERFAGLGVEFLASPFSDGAIELDVGRVEFRLARLQRAVEAFDQSSHFVAIEIAVVVVQVVEVRQLCRFWVRRIGPSRPTHRPSARTKNDRCRTDRRNWKSTY